MIVRRARREDVPAIVELLRDDDLGAGRESPAGEPLPRSYDVAFEAIERDPNSELMFLTHLSSRGGRVAQVESVRDRIRDDALGRREGERERLPPDSTHVEQGAQGRSPVLRASRLPRHS